jgi:hypothetical protein
MEIAHRKTALIQHFFMLGFFAVLYPVKDDSAETKQNKYT